MSQSATEKYLNNYAEQEVHLLKDFPIRTYNNVLIIPAYQESKAFIDQYLVTDYWDQSLLIILIINQPDDDNNELAQQNLFNSIHASSYTLWQQHPLSLFKHSDNKPHILCINRFESELRLNPKKAVGHARKIAADCALYLIHKQIIASDWICSTDADASLPKNYFSVVNEQINAQALTFNYQHQTGDDDLSRATTVYEQGLKYYQAGLEWANSPYAFHSLGSCIAVNKQAYVSVRGFPKRAGGEDFYLLNKLAKLGTIIHLVDTTITIASRTSQRVPFGTGPAVEKIMQLQSIANYPYYHPNIFIELKTCLKAFSNLQTQHTLQSWLDCFNEPTTKALLAIGIEKYYQHHLKQSISQRRLLPDLNTWFDGLTTLKYIHYLRDHYWPNIPLSESLQIAPYYS